jgi:hypothetical protein
VAISELAATVKFRGKTNVIRLDRLRHADERSELTDMLSA